MKLHVGLSHGTMIPEFVAVSDGREGDLAQGQRFDLPKGSSVACDKDYVNYGWYKSLTDKGVFFVTRLKTTSIYHVVERRMPPANSGVTSDQIIQLKGLSLGLILPLLAFPILFFAGEINRNDSAAITAHYGPVSVGTYAVGVLKSSGIPYETYFPLFVALLEMLAVIVGIALARGSNIRSGFKKSHMNYFVIKALS